MVVSEVGKHETVVTEAGGHVERDCATPRVADSSRTKVELRRQGGVCSTIDDHVVVEVDVGVVRPAEVAGVGVKARRPRVRSDGNAWIQSLQALQAGFGALQTEGEIEIGENERVGGHGKIEGCESNVYIYR